MYYLSMTLVADSHPDVQSVEQGDDADVWLITGCSSGFGAALAEAALKRGHRVVATARRLDPLQRLADSWPGQVLPLQLDVTNRDNIRMVVEQVLAELGRVDVLVNNAGRVHFGAVEEVADADLRALFELNVFGPANLCRAVLPHMRERGRGTIVQMSSMGSFYISTGFSSYTASKAALEGMSATLAMEVAPFGIRVIILEPGGHRTSVFSPEQIGMAPPLPAYRDIVGPTWDFVTGLDGHQEGDPVRAAEIVVNVVGDPEPPLRLPLGNDAVDLIGAALNSIGDNLRRWEKVARSTAFGADAVPRPSDPATK